MTIVFIVEYVPMTARGLPHSEISGSSLLAAPRSLSQLATSFIALVPRYPPVCSYYFYLTQNCTALARRNILIAHSAMRRFHVWHMKVLLYAVFKDRRRCRRFRTAAISSRHPTAADPQNANCMSPSLKAEQCSLVERTLAIGL